MSFLSALHPIKAFKNFCSSFLDAWYESLYKSWEFTKCLAASLACTLGLILFPITYILILLYIMIWHHADWVRIVEASKKRKEEK